MQKKITEEAFINLYIGAAYADVTGLRGTKLRIRVPPEYTDDVESIRRECNATVAQSLKDEFSITRFIGNEKMLFRVTSFENTSGDLVFIVRRPPARVMDFAEIGFGEELVSLLTRPDLRGVVGFIGEMESGKTTAAASSVRGRLLALGGIAVAIEDPPETNLDGEHGDGRCISVEVGAGGYKAATKKAMRTGASIIYLGEVRDEDPAAEVAMGGNNGHLIFTTWHAGSIEDGVKRIAAMCGKTISNPENLLSTGLAALIHLRLEDHTINTMKGKKVTKVLRYNFLEIKDHIETQNIIRNGNFHKLQDAMETQKANRRASSI